MIAMRSVVSGHIEALGHHEGDLYVQFKGGSRYMYKGVPKSLYETAFDDGVSPGKWLDSKVKGKFPHSKLEKESK